MIAKLFYPFLFIFLAYTLLLLHGQVKLRLDEIEDRNTLIKNLK